MEKTWGTLLAAATEDVRRLDSVVRFSSIPVVVQETVSQHSYWVSLYSVMVARALGLDDGTVGGVAVAGLTHDLGECVTGDVVRTFKYSTQELKKAVDEAENRLVDRLPPEIQDLYIAGEDMVPEGNKELAESVVKAADWMALYQYLRREAARGNWEIIPFYSKMITEFGEIWMNDKGPLNGLYFSLLQEAKAVAKDRFGDAIDSSRWLRKV